MNILDLEQKAEAVSELLGSMANAKRLMVMCQLLEGELPVGELAQRIGLSQSALSQHLAKLRQRGLVATRRESQTVFYRLASLEVRALLQTLYALYCAPLQSANCADNTPPC